MDKKIREGGIYYNREYDMIYYVISVYGVAMHFINTLLYSGDIDKKEYENDKLVEHYDDVEEGLIEFIKRFSCIKK